MTRENSTTGRQVSLAAPASAEGKQLVWTSASCSNTVKPKGLAAMAWQMENHAEQQTRQRQERQNQKQQVNKVSFAAVQRQFVLGGLRAVE